METIEYMYINNVCVFYIAKVQLSFTIMVGGDFVVGFVCSCKHKLQLNINCNDHLQMIYIYIYIYIYIIVIQNMIHLQTNKN
jgi:hypothetical protein